MLNTKLLLIITIYLTILQMANAKTSYRPPEDQLIDVNKNMDNAKTGDRLGNPQLVVLRDGKSILFHEIYAKNVTTLYGYNDNSSDSNPLVIKFQKYKQSLENWIDLIKNTQSTKLATSLLEGIDLINEFILINHEINYPVEQYSTYNITKHYNTKIAAFYLKNKVYISIPRMESLTTLQESTGLTKEKAQGFVLVNEIINAIYATTLSYYDSELKRCGNNRCRQIKSAELLNLKKQKFTLSSTILQIATNNISVSNFQFKLVINGIYDYWKDITTEQKIKLFTIMNQARFTPTLTMNYNPWVHFTGGFKNTEAQYRLSFLEHIVNKKPINYYSPIFVAVDGKNYLKNIHEMFRILKLKKKDIQKMNLLDYSSFLDFTIKSNSFVAGHINYFYKNREDLNQIDHVVISNFLENLIIYITEEITDECTKENLDKIQRIFPVNYYSVNDNKELLEIDDLYFENKMFNRYKNIKECLEKKNSTITSN